MALVAVATVPAASPSQAFVAYACTAKDSHGVKSRYEYFGWFSFNSKISATSFALAACKAKSKTPDSCKITVCTKTHT